MITCYDCKAICCVPCEIFYYVYNATVTLIGTILFPSLPIATFSAKHASKQKREKKYANLAKFTKLKNNNWANQRNLPLKMVRLRRTKKSTNHLPETFRGKEDKQQCFRLSPLCTQMLLRNPNGWTQNGVVANQPSILFFFFYSGLRMEIIIY